MKPYLKFLVYAVLMLFVPTCVVNRFTFARSASWEHFLIALNCACNIIMGVGALALLGILFYMPRRTTTVKDLPYAHRLTVMLALMLVSTSAFYSSVTLSLPQGSEIALNVGWAATILWGCWFHAATYVKK